MRSLVSIALLVLTIGWIVLSYVPKSLLSLPTFTIGERLTSLSPLILGAIFILFVGIQLVLVSFSRRMFRDEASSQQAKVFALQPTTELFWTALPLFVTLILVAVIFLG